MFEQLPGKLQGALDSVPQPQRKRSAPSQLPVGQSQRPQRAPETDARSQNVGNFTHRSNISLNQQGSSKRLSTVQGSVPPHDQVATFDPGHPRGLQDPYTASNHSSSGSLPPSAASCGMQNTHVPELSSMMFPSADPFAYPNQPMTTLENRQLVKQENPVDHRTFSPPNSTGAPYENLGYGSLPYMTQGQLLGFGMRSMDPSIDMSDAGPMASTIITDRNEGGGWAQQQQQQQQRPGGTSDGNVDQFFAEDWRGWMNQGYRQYP